MEKREGKTVTFVAGEKPEASRNVLDISLPVGNTPFYIKVIQPEGGAYRPPDNNNDHATHVPTGTGGLDNGFIYRSILQHILPTLTTYTGT